MRIELYSALRLSNLLLLDNKSMYIISLEKILVCKHNNNSSSSKKTNTK